MDRLTVKNLSKKFETTVALDDLSFSVKEGEIFGLLGPNGAGKTTAMHIILGIIHPTSGQITLLGKNPHKERYDIYPKINFSSAYVQLPFNLTVERNLMIFAKLYGIDSPKEKIYSLLKKFQVDHRARFKTGALSSGEQTRVNLCKSLLNDPEILFLDEPTASLDPDIAELVREGIHDIQKERKLTIIYTSHNMAEVEAICHRIIFIHKGKKIIEGTPHEVRESFNKESLEKVFIHLARSGDIKEQEISSL